MVQNIEKSRGTISGLCGGFKISLKRYLTRVPLLSSICVIMHYQNTADKFFLWFSSNLGMLVHIFLEL